MALNLRAEIKMSRPRDRYKRKLLALYSMYRQAYIKLLALYSMYRQAYIKCMIRQYGEETIRAEVSACQILTKQKVQSENF